MPKRQIIGLDLIRFTAAFMVMLFHLGFWISAGPPSSTALRAAGSTIEMKELGALASGRVGVEIFFVLSGFVIAYSAEHATARQFLKSRLLRLAPAVWVVAPLTAAVGYAIGFKPPDVIFAMLLRTLFFSPLGPYVDGVYWTLGVEIGFYLLVLLLLLVDRLKFLPASIATIGLISAIHCVANALDPSRVIRWGPPSLIERCAQLLLIDHGCFFALGVFLWLTLLKKTTAPRIGLMICFAIGALASIASWSKSLAVMSRETFNPSLPPAIWILSVAMIALSVRFNNLGAQGTRIPTIARALGLASYPLYLIHDLIGAAALGWLCRAGVDKYAALLAVVLALTAAALAIALVIEPRARALLRLGLDGASFSRKQATQNQSK